MERRRPRRPRRDAKRHFHLWHKDKEEWRSAWYPWPAGTPALHAGCLPPLPWIPYAARMSIGFKEWTLVCDALGSGAQSIIIRKGGIAEGRAGFRFQHGEFLLFPTLFHEQVAKLKLPPGTALPPLRADGWHEMTLRARVEWTQEAADLAVVRRLAPFHCWQDSEVEKRFHYELPSAKREAERSGGEPVAGGVSVAFVRVDKMSRPFVFPDSPKFGGCRSWIELPEPPAGVTFSPVLDDASHREREAAIRSVLGSVHTKTGLYSA